MGCRGVMTWACYKIEGWLGREKLSTTKNESGDSIRDFHWIVNTDGKRRTILK